MAYKLDQIKELIQNLFIVTQSEVLINLKYNIYLFLQL